MEQRNKLQSERLDFLLDALKEDSIQYKNLQVGNSETEKRNAVRSLMNVRMPRSISDDFLEVQDIFLQEEAKEKGIVTCNDIPVIEQEYPCSEIKNSDRISLWRGDITRLGVDAIVNAANSQLLGCFVPCHGCIDNAIHSAAGIQLRNECAEIMAEQGHEEPIGKAKITKGYNLPAKHVIHTVGPIVGLAVTEKQKEQLKDCYLNCLKVAEKSSLKSIAFCCISTGEFHFPNKLAAEIAVDTVDRFLTKTSIERVIFNVFKEQDFNIYKKLFC